MLVKTLVIFERVLSPLVLDSRDTGRENWNVANRREHQKRALASRLSGRTPAVGVQLPFDWVDPVPSDDRNIPRASS